MRNFFANAVSRKDDFVGFKEIRVDLSEMSPSEYTVGVGHMKEDSEMTLSHKGTSDRSLNGLQLFSFSHWMRLNSVTTVASLATWDVDKKGSFKVAADHKVSDETSVRGNFVFPSMLLTIGLRQKLTNKVTMLFTS